MSWCVYSGADDVYVGLDDAGALSAWGNAAHEPKPDYTQLRAAECSWTLVSATATDVEIDGAGCGLLGRVRAAPDEAHYAIQFHEAPPALIGVTIVLPERRHAAALDLVRTVLAHPGVGLLITLGSFIGFREPGAANATPTIGEFLGGSPLFGSEVSLSIARPFAARARR